MAGFLRLAHHLPYVEHYSDFLGDLQELHAEGLRCLREHRQPDAGIARVEQTVDHRSACAHRPRKLRLGQVALGHGPLDLRGKQLLLSEQLDILAFPEFVEQRVQRRADVFFFLASLCLSSDVARGPGPTGHRHWTWAM